MRKPDSVNRDLMALLGKRVRALREATGATARDFAEANDYDRNLWGRIERGQQNVSVSTLLKVAVALRVPMADLVADIEQDLVRPGAVAGTDG